MLRFSLFLIVVLSIITFSYGSCPKDKRVSKVLKLPCCDTGYGNWAYERCRQEYWKVLNEFEKRKIITSQLAKFKKVTLRPEAKNGLIKFTKKTRG